MKKGLSTSSAIKSVVNVSAIRELQEEVVINAFQDISTSLSVLLVFATDMQTHATNFLEFALIVVIILLEIIVKCKHF